MRELDKCLEIAKEIKEKLDDIKELEAKAMSAKNQIITDMPKGSGAPQNEFELYMIKKQEKEFIISELKALQYIKWDIVLAALNCCRISDSETIKMLELRFMNGYSWKKCAAKMNEQYPLNRWNINKCFRVNRYVLNKLHKKYN